MPTREEIINLKNQWCADPCWDLHETPGFEKHTAELKIYQQEKSEQWARERAKKLARKAEMIGCPGNIKLAAFVEHLENRIKELEEKIAICVIAPNP